MEPEHAADLAPRHRGEGGVADRHILGGVLVVVVGDKGQLAHIPEDKEVGVTVNGPARRRNGQSGFVR
jgi:hypothetical protein